MSYFSAIYFLFLFIRVLYRLCAQRSLITKIFFEMNRVTKMKNLSDYRALTFDCYGTLIDWETGIWNAGQPLIMENNRGDITRESFLHTFATAETYQEATNPNMVYTELLSTVHKSIANTFNLKTNESLDLNFGGSVEHWPEFDDSQTSLKFLKQHLKLIILSNVDRKSFAQSNKKLGVNFDAIYTAEDIGSYKPNPNNFNYMIDHLKKTFDIERNDILHVAQSMHHDLVEAKSHGLDTAWIDRQRLSEGGKWGATAKVPEIVKPNFLFFSMSEMVTAFQSA